MHKIKKLQTNSDDGGTSFIFVNEFNNAIRGHDKAEKFVKLVSNGFAQTDQFMFSFRRVTLFTEPSGRFFINVKMIRRNDMRGKYIDFVKHDEFAEIIPTINWLMPPNEETDNKFDVVNMTTEKFNDTIAYVAPNAIRNSFPFGKHRGESVVEVFRDDRNYIDWFMENCKSKYPGDTITKIRREIDFLKAGLSIKNQLKVIKEQKDKESRRETMEITESLPPHSAPIGCWCNECGALLFHDDVDSDRPCPGDCQKNNDDADAPF